MHHADFGSESVEPAVGTQCSDTGVHAGRTASTLATASSRGTGLEQKDGIASTTPANGKPQALRDSPL